MLCSAITTGLAVEVRNHSNIILSLGSTANDRKYIDCEETRTSKEFDDSDFLYVPTNMVSAWALGSLLLLMGVYLSIFLVNAIKLHKLFRYRVNYIP